MPVAWSINPVLAEQFPALFDFFARTATANDSFVSGPGGAGYVYWGTLSTDYLHAFATRAGQLIRQYGPNVIDTYGQANLSTMQTFSTHCAENGGEAPLMYINEPTGGPIPFAYYECPNLNMALPDVNATVVCTSHAPGLFYIPGALGKAPCKSCELARRIQQVAHGGTHFINVYGGLHWTAGAEDPSEEFWTLLHDTAAALGEDFVVVGAQEAARLSQEYHAGTPTGQHRTQTPPRHAHGTAPGKDVPPLAHGPTVPRPRDSTAPARSPLLGAVPTRDLRALWTFQEVTAAPKLDLVHGYALHDLNGYDTGIPRGPALSVFGSVCGCVRCARLTGMAVWPRGRLQLASGAAGVVQPRWRVRAVFRIV
eukprot:m.416696 g.416696  ORF g.416696 m.416696 type:complete len:368 (+) comp21282_c0_seq9:1590-2693(+)